MIRILIADDHAVVRRGLTQILSEESDMRVVAEAGSAEEALTMMRDTPVDVAVLDISMPGKSGLDMLSDIKKARSGTRVLLLSMHPEAQFAARALKAGAAGYLTKDSAPDELVRAIRKICSGRTYISESFAERLASTLGTDPSILPHQFLSAREFEVLRFLASGLTVSQVADRLSLSSKTVSTYRTRILQKMNMKTNAELTRYALEHNLVE